MTIQPLRLPSMKILLISNIFPPEVWGGYELLAEDIALQLREAGHDVRVLTSEASQNDPRPWVERSLELTYPFQNRGREPRFRHLYLARQHRLALQKTLEEFPAHVALIFSLRRLGVHLAHALQARELPCVYCLNDLWPLDFTPNFSSFLARRKPSQSSTPSLPKVGKLRRTLQYLRPQEFLWPKPGIRRAIIVSQFLASRLKTGGLVIRAPRICYQGIRVAEFTKRAGGNPNADDSALSPPKKRGSEAHRKQKPLRLLSCGRIHPSKGIEFCLSTLQKLHAQNYSARLTIIGTGSAAYLRELADLSVNLGISQSVDFLGAMPRRDLAKQYARHDVFIFAPRWEEPLGLTYLEAFACSLPVVARPTGGSRELLLHRHNSLIARNSPEAARQIRELQVRPLVRRRLIAGGHATLQDTANLNNYATAIEEELRKAQSDHLAERENHWNP
ncbi:MAG: glycosyltransferase family 4 protein [Polyangiaceae bacterium]|nr:glycosyltransferase family 4 protein [Polyangiaceae bacterium]